MRRQRHFKITSYNAQGYYNDSALYEIPDNIIIPLFSELDEYFRSLSFVPSIEVSYESWINSGGVLLVEVCAENAVTNGMTYILK